MQVLKTVGIIGGLGPETTTRFYLEVIYACQKLNNTHRPPLLIWNIPISYAAELKEITEGIYHEDMLRLLVTAAQRLEKGGADFIALPCNSAHKFFQQIQQGVNIPVLNIVTETINYLKQRQITKVGVLATLVTRQTALYAQALQDNAIAMVEPNAGEQSKLNQLILQLTYGSSKKNAKGTLESIISRLSQENVQHMILACAGLSSLLPAHPQLAIHDTMKIYAAATVREILHEFG